MMMMTPVVMAMFMVMIMIMALSVPSISPTLRLKRFFNPLSIPAKASHHIL
jgi:hypothetical protein